ncbi:MAG: ethanolamine ammonia-lyase reactivating factor EutA [Promethearchaeota archaeon]
MLNLSKSARKRFDSFEFHFTSLKSYTSYYLHIFAQDKPDLDAEKFISEFQQNYDKLIDEIIQEGDSDLTRFFKAISQFKPALGTVLSPGQDFDSVCDMVVSSFNVTLKRIREQINDKQYKVKAKGAILPGSGSMELQYFCTVCKELFEIPPDMKEKLLNSDETLDLPEHCGKSMVVKIAKVQPKESIEEKEEKFEIIDIPPAEILMGYQSTKETGAEYLDVLSVGIDIGSSTSHLVFSRLSLKRERSFFNMTNRFNMVNREIIYEGNIIFTPLLDKDNIDIEAVVKFCEGEYKKAGVTRDMIDTGAVIVTGETAKKKNASEIAGRLSSETGKFVSATAGPNFESFLSIKGSGIVAQTRERQNTIMNVDVGGGTSNIAIASKGDVVSCSCINVGGRLLGIEGADGDAFTIWRIDDPTEHLMEKLGIKYKVGDTIPLEDVKQIVRAYAEALVEVMQGPATSPIAKMLMMTNDIDLSIPVDEYSFSGGVGEFMYNGSDSPGNFNDIGLYLAEEIEALLEKNGMVLAEPENKIRATVIGAGSFSLSVSGSTCYVDKNVPLPINNIPVIPILIDQETLTPENLATEIKRAYGRFDLIEGEDVAALYFGKFFIPRADLLEKFARGFELAHPNAIANKTPVIFLFKNDLAKLLGLTIHRKTKLQKNVIILDELTLESGDFIDIGPMLQSSNAYPITVKSLVFNKKIGDE